MWSVLQISSALPFGPYQKHMHSHVVLFRSALLYGPFGILKCTPMWSLLLFGVHSHVVLNNFWSALPYGPYDMVLIILRNALRSSPLILPKNREKIVILEI